MLVMTMTGGGTDASRKSVDASVREILRLKRECGATDRPISRTISETRGFMKSLVEADGDRILGFIMVGAEAGEVMSVVQTAMLAGMPYTGLRDAIITHRQWRRASSRSSRTCRPDKAGARHPQRPGDAGLAGRGILNRLSG